MNNTKQVIVVNKALKMPTGKLSTQVAHASLGALLDTACGWANVNDNGVIENNQIVVKRKDHNEN